MNRTPRFEESLLGEIPSVLFVLDHSVYHRKHLRAVFGDELVKGYGFALLTALNQIEIVRF
jgi:hypothetical protein